VNQGEEKELYRQWVNSETAFRAPDEPIYAKDMTLISLVANYKSKSKPTQTPKPVNQEFWDEWGDMPVFNYYSNDSDYCIGIETLSISELYSAFEQRIIAKLEEAS
jgi:hypothetical protein